MELKYKSYLIYNNSNSNEPDDNFSQNFNINHIGIQNLLSSTSSSFIITYSTQKNSVSQQEQRIVIPPKENWEIGLETEEPLNIYISNISGSICSEELQDTSLLTSQNNPIGICYFSYWED